MIKIEIDKQAMPEITKFLPLLAKDTEDGRKARETFAAFVGPVISQVLNQANTFSFMFTPFSYNLGTAPSIPLDYFDSNEEGLFDIWSTSIPGGLPTNHVTGVEDFRIATMQLDSAFSMLRRHAEESRMDVVTKGLERLGQELLVKQEYHAWSVAFAAAAKKNGQNAVTAGSLQVEDLNQLKIRASRVRKSWVGGTPEGGTR
jgi:hypothetical protein